MSRRRRAALIAGVIAVCAGAVVAVCLLPSGSRDADPAPASVRSPTAHASTRPPPVGPIPGYLLIADRGNNRMLLVDGGKRILWRYPKPGTKPAMPFTYDDDAFFAPGWGSVITNEEDQQTIEQISFPGAKLEWSYGHVNAPGSSSGYLDGPDDAYVRPDGLRTVADIRNCRILFIAPNRRVAHQLGTTGSCVHDPPRSFAEPNGDTPLPNGDTLVTEIDGAWIDRVSLSGQLRWAVQAPITYPSDAQLLPRGRILIAGYTSPGQIVIMSRKGHVLWRYGPSVGPGALDHPSLALRLPNGLIAINDDYNDRVVLIDPLKDRIVWQYGHDNRPGKAPGYLNIPDGLDFLPARDAPAGLG